MLHRTYVLKYSMYVIAIGLTVGCTSNSECSRSESCINQLCISPCNCGDNAECTVNDHYPICFCKPGYSGNPQIGCVKCKLYKPIPINYVCLIKYIILH